MCFSLVQAEDRTWYVGASAGKAKLDSNINLESTEKADEKNTGYKIYGGYKFNKYLATELYYTDLGTVTYKDETAPYDMKFDSQSYGITAVVSYPIHKNIEPFIKGGFQHWKVKASGRDALGDKPANNNGNKSIYGAGINFPITECISLRTEYEVIKLSESKYKFLSAGLIYKFLISRKCS